MCTNLDDEIQYLKLREKKIMYLIHLMQSKGYPVQNIYEKELKKVNTMRIQEFIEQKDKENYEREHGGPELDEKYHFSFHTDDSFEPIDDGPMLKPRKPDCIPLLCFDDIPGYETSSDEAENDGDDEEEYTHDGSKCDRSHVQRSERSIAVNEEETNRDDNGS
jgi:hypothetical protein